jgi:hypothetical protein
VRVPGIEIPLRELARELLVQHDTKLPPCLTGALQGGNSDSS